MPYKITPTLKVGDKGADVVNLQDALRLLINRRKLTIDDPALKKRLLSALASERKQEIFGGNGTLSLVKVFQVGSG